MKGTLRWINPSPMHSVASGTTLHKSQALEFVTREYENLSRSANQLRVASIASLHGLNPMEPVRATVPMIVYYTALLRKAGELGSWGAGELRRWGDG
ncbi:hypothetical protein, partial [Coleofasciculus sp. LEGE 07081]